MNKAKGTVYKHDVYREEVVNDIAHMPGGEMGKIKVSSAEIVVHGTKEKPYYEIKYFDLFDNLTHIGFSSYNLDIVFHYLENYFEVVEKGGEHG